MGRIYKSLCKNNITSVIILKSIKDCVHGYITVDNQDLDILNTECMERLRHIHHLGVGFLIYPGSTHSRFEHSLGVMHIGSRIFEHLVSSDKAFRETLSTEDLQKMRKTLKWALLLHDTGHTPFSHTLEDFCKIGEVLKEMKRLNFKFYNPKERKHELIAIDKIHELMGSYLVLTEYNDLLNCRGVDPNAVAALILGKIGEVDAQYRPYLNIMRSIVDSTFDADKIDYILRDDYMSGVDLVKLDVDRLISAYCINHETLYLNDRAMSVIMNLINARELLYLWVYQHHKVVFTDVLFRYMVKRAIEIDTDFENKFLTSDSIKNMVDDHDVIVYLKNSADPTISYYYNMIKTRKYLSSVWKHRFDLEEICSRHIIHRIPNMLYNDDIIDEVRKTICDIHDIRFEDLIIAKKEYAPFTPLDAKDTSIVINGEPKQLDSFEYIKPTSESFGKTAYMYCPSNKKEQLRDWFEEGIKENFGHLLL